uniref:Arf-GAP domain-containing protein n=1 Tax=Musa acuminata subsp. malaccensis TaxID=214687 RepID=A0A804JRC6_MUSAM|nr:PREDICTED: probable ADP-ribosylation factor GTPase-activating protein AGD14 isoform X1 [Musa acuminata subsp. malaccensis]
MSSKREEVRNEKIIRGLMKLPPNRKCINCNSLGPQYVCTNFWTFVCIVCSGIHREFTHRVKSVSLARFTTQEVEALQRGGNQLAREIYLKDWDMQRMRFPDSSNADKIREFIKDVYVNKKYARGNSTGKPSRDIESSKNHELEQRRASSYHSFSQSPPYEYQYEDRRYGKQFGMLNRKPGSNQGHYDGKTGSSIYSSSHVTYEDRFANESSGSRMSDFSISSAGDTFKYDVQSLSSQDNGCCSPSLYLSRDAIHKDAKQQTLNQFTETNAKRNLDGMRCPKRTSSAGSFGSLDSSSISHRSFSPANAVDIALEPVHSSGIQQAKATIFSSTQSSASIVTGNKDLLNSSFVQQPMSTSPSIDLFANFNNQSSSLSPFEHKPNSLGVVDVVLESVHSSGTQQAKTSTFSSAQSPASIHTGNKDIVGPTFVQKPNTSSTSVDLFADLSNQPSSTIPIEHRSAADPVPQNDGWATFDLPHHVGVDSAMSPVISAVELSGSGAPKERVGGWVSPENDSGWFPFQNPLAPGPMTVTSGQLHSDLQERTRSADQNNSQLWNTFDDSTKKVPQASVGGLPQNSISWIHVPDFALHDTNVALKVMQDFDKDGFQRSAMDAGNPCLDQPVGVVAGSPLSLLVKPGGVDQPQKSTNPFDLPYDAHLEPMNAFLDMSSLETALPSTQLINDYLAGVAQPWNSQNAAATYISSLPEGGLQYMSGQGPSSHFPKFPPQGPGASVGGNPFA